MEWTHFAREEGVWIIFDVPHCRKRSKIDVEFHESVVLGGYSRRLFLFETTRRAAHRQPDTSGAYAVRQCEATKGDKPDSRDSVHTRMGAKPPSLQHEEWRSETAAILAGPVPFDGRFIFDDCIVVDDTAA
jgi:hypothetical protein